MPSVPRLLLPGINPLRQLGRILGIAFQYEAEIEHFLEVKFPRIRRLAEKLGAEIGFEDEAGVEPRTRSGRTWGLIGQPPVLPVSPQRSGYNLLSVVTAQGRLDDEITDQTLNSDVYIDFLAQLIQDRERPLILLVDRAPFHQSPSRA